MNMGMTKCGHCGHDKTKLLQLEASWASNHILAVTCASCNSILGVTNADTGAALKAADRKIDIMAANMASLQSQIKALQTQLQSLTTALQNR